MKQDKFHWATMYVFSQAQPMILYIQAQIKRRYHLVITLRLNCVTRFINKKVQGGPVKPIFLNHRVI